MVDAVVNVFIERLLDALEEEGRFLAKDKEQFEKLKNELLLMESFLKDAERLKRKNQTLRSIMVILRELIYEAESILDDYQAHSLHSNGNSKLSLCFHPGKLPLRYRCGKRLCEINEKITDIKQNISSYLGVPLLNEANSMEVHDLLTSRWSSPVYDHTQVVGLEGDTKKIMEWLLQASDGLLAIGVVGMGGLGKTTIAQKVFNDQRMGDHFDRRIWVSVSQSFNEEQVMRSVLRSVGDACVGDDKSELLRKIYQYLLGKRYLIVMDDVWSLDSTWWLKICEGLPKGNGSSVIITTRIEKVARKMGVDQTRTHWPEFLNKDNSWLLFRKIAFAASGGECAYPELEHVGKEIVEKCKGLPLAIKAVGGVMLCKQPNYIEWKRISERFLEELAENDNSVMASLQLSYDELPPYLKSCFLCFSLFPEDCVISKDQLIHWWIGESFVPLRNGRLSTEVGEDCFSELTNRCLIEVVNKAYNGVMYTVKIHDMIRDLVIKIAEENAFCARSDPACRHLGIKTDMNGKNLTKNQKLRALLTTTKSGEVNKIPSETTKKFCQCEHLQVLDLSKSIFDVPLSTLLAEIGCLHHLSYLSLSNTHPLIELPNTLAKLQKLQILDFSYCQNLKSLPPCITAFDKLVVLNVNNCGSLEYLPKGLSKLSNLQVLLGFRPAKSNQSRGCRIDEIRRLSHLRTLGLCLTHGDEIEDDEVDALLHLRQLQVLTISCFDGHGDDLIAKLDRLCPPRQLHELSLQFYPGKLSPGWLDPASLPMLRYLSIASGGLARMNESFWGDGNTLWKIEGQMLEALSDLSEEWSAIHKAMPFLRILSVSWCPELDGFPMEDAGFKGGIWKKEERWNRI